MTHLAKPGLLARLAGSLRRARARHGPLNFQGVPLDAPSLAVIQRSIRLKLLAQKQTTAALADQAVVSGSSFLLAVLIGHFIGAEALGVYGVLVGALLLASATQDGAISTTYMTRRPELDVARKRSHAAANLIFAIGFAFICVLLAALYFYYSFRISERPPEFALLAGVPVVALIPLFILREHLRRFEFACLRIDGALLLDAAAFGLQFVLIGLLVMTGHASLQAFLLAMAIGNGVAVAWFLLRRRDELFVARPPLLPVAIEIVQFSKWVLLALVLFVAALHIMPWLVIASLGAAEAGAFAACLMLANLATPVLTGCINWMMPSAAVAYTEHGTHAVFAAVRRQTLGLAAFAGGFGLVTAVFAEELLMLAFGAVDAASGELLALLVAAFFVRTLGVGAYIGLWAQRTPELNVVANLVMLGVCVVVGLALMPHWGVLGAGVGVLCGDVAAVTVRWLFFIQQGAKVRCAQ